MPQVVTAVLRTELIQFLATLDILKIRMNRIRLLGRMDALKKWMIIWFTPYQTMFK